MYVLFAKPPPPCAMHLVYDLMKMAVVGMLHMELLLIFHAAFCHSKSLFIVKKPVYKAPTILRQMKMHIILVAVPQLLAQPLSQ